MSNLKDEVGDLKVIVTALKLEVQQSRDELQNICATKPMPNLEYPVPLKSDTFTARCTDLHKVSGIGGGEMSGGGGMRVSGSSGGSGQGGKGVRNENKHTGVEVRSYGRGARSRIEKSGGGAGGAVNSPRPS